MIARMPEKLTQYAQEVLNKTDIDNMSESGFAMLGAALAIVDHEDKEMARQEREAPRMAVASPQDTRRPRYGVLDEFSDILARYDDTRSTADRDEMRVVLKQQLDDIERELVEMRMCVHDDVAVRYFIEFRENLRMRL